ncbi:hypothetical protein TNCV_2846441 [Trichonephila clavipes]|nr:hypothetical protein TNCV_2846441 [Trichonephila clavipes]
MIIFMLQENDGIRNFIQSLREDDQLAGYVKMMSLEGHFPDKNEPNFLLKGGRVSLETPWRKAGSLKHSYNCPAPGIKGNNDGDSNEGDSACLGGHYHIETYESPITSIERPKRLKKGVKSI